MKVSEDLGDLKNGEGGGVELGMGGMKVDANYVVVVVVVDSPTTLNAKNPFNDIDNIEIIPHMNSTRNKIVQTSNLDFNFDVIGCL